MRQILPLLLLVGTSLPCHASCDFDQVVGYTLVAKKTVVGFIQDDKRGDEFSGCEFGRILVFDDNTGIRCTGYNYTYSYRPDVCLCERLPQHPGLPENEWFDVAPLR